MSGDDHPNAVELGWIFVDCQNPNSLAAWWQAMVGGDICAKDGAHVRLEEGPLSIMFLRVPDQQQV